MGKDLDIIQAVKEQDIGSLQKIIQKSGKLTNSKKLIGNNKNKLNVNYQDGDGMSALHQAALMGNSDVIQLLVESGASTELRDNKGMIPLHYATWQGKSEPVHILLQKGSPVNMQAQLGETPLHLACQHGHMDVTNLLLLHHADPTVSNKEHKTPMDLACEFGRYKIAEMLLRNNLCLKLLEVNEKDLVDNNQTTCMHLAARNGHSDIITLLLQMGMDINRSTLNGTCLHEASLYGKIDVVKLLLDCGIDVNKPNSYDQTALDIVNKFTTTRAAKELKHILKEASCAVHARAIKDFHNVYDDDSISFKEGDIITVLEQKPDGIWRGYVVQTGRMAKTGCFPANHVVLVDSQVVAKQQQHGKSPAKRINMPPVPDLLNRSPGYMGSQHLGSIAGEDAFPPPPSPINMARHRDGSGTENNHHGHHHHTYHAAGQYAGGKALLNQHGGGGDHVGDWPPSPSHISLHPGPGGDMRASSPAKDPHHSPAHSNRNSAASSDSGRGVSTGHLEPKVHSLVTVQVGGQHRLSGQSYESGVSSRQSYHSTSSSSLGSLDRLEESGYASTVNVAELFHAGVPDHEVLQTWLGDLKFDEYYDKFVNAGYDMPTISRMTPEDLTAIGITKPVHRKRLKAEIARLNIHDGIPDFKPNDMLEWLHLLGLSQYYQTLTGQGYDNIDFVTDITWEDLEEIGIQKLGHQKKIMLAIDRLKRIMSGSKRLSSMEKRRASQELLDPPPPMNSTRWSGDMAPQYMTELGVGAKPKKSPSGDSIATNSSGTSGASGGSGASSGSGGSGEMRITHLRDAELHRQNSSGSGGPDVVAIQVKRSSAARTPSATETIPEGKDMAGQPITYQSFQSPTEPRKSGNGLPDFAGGVPMSEQYREDDSVFVAPVAPNQGKPKPVAKIIAKTKRSSRDESPDMEIEKHESECNSDGNKEYSLAGGMVQNSLEKTRQWANSQQREPIYDKPNIGPPLKAPKPKPGLIIPKPTPNEPGSPGPASPLCINTQNHDAAAPSTPSPTGKGKKAPPPPPKRTHSIRDMGPTETNGQPIQQRPPPTHHPAPPPISAKPQQRVQAQPQASPQRVQPQPQSQPRIQAQPTAQQRLQPQPTPQQRIQPQPSPQQRVQAQPSPQQRVQAHPQPSPQQRVQVQAQASPQQRVQVQAQASPQQRVQVQAQASPQPPQQDLPPKQQAFASCVQSLSQRFGSKREESGSQENTSSDGEEFPPPPPPIAMDIITPKIHNYGIPTKSEKAAAGFQGKIHRDLSHSPHEKRGFPEKPDGRTFGVNLRKQGSPPKELTRNNVQEHSRPDLDSRMTLSDKRSDSTTSFESTSSTSSVDSNTLPFANENVGTIKQRTPAAKPSIVEFSDGYDGQSSGMFAEENSGTLKRGAGMSYNHSGGAMISQADPSHRNPGARPVVTVSGMANQTQKGAPRPPPIANKPKAMQQQLQQKQLLLQQQQHLQQQQQHLQQQQQLHQQLQSAQASSNHTGVVNSAAPVKKETGDVLFDIDNMLQGLTEELDAMLEEESGC